jgi:hypothetical protein
MDTKNRGETHEDPLPAECRAVRATESWLARSPTAVTDRLLEKVAPQPHALQGFGIVTARAWRAIAERTRAEVAVPVAQKSRDSSTAKTGA